MSLDETFRDLIFEDCLPSALTTPTTQHCTCNVCTHWRMQKTWNKLQLEGARRPRRTRLVSGAILEQRCPFRPPMDNIAMAHPWRFLAGRRDRRQRTVTTYEAYSWTTVLVAIDSHTKNCWAKQNSKRNVWLKVLEGKIFRGLNFRGSSLIRENRENFTPRKFLAIRYYCGFPGPRKFDAYDHDMWIYTLDNENFNLFVLAKPRNI